MHYGFGPYPMLDNGAHVLLKHTRHDGIEIVLARYHGKFVTWLVHQGEADSGNYFERDQVQAVKDWIKRVEEYQAWLAHDIATSR